MDTNGGVIANATVRLSIKPGGPDRETQSTSDGEFSFTDVPSGPYELTFTAQEFVVRTVTGTLNAGENLVLGKTALQMIVSTDSVNVTASVAEIAEAQVKVEEKQRVLGILPNFLASYDPNPAPLTAKQKFELTSKTFLDPTTFAITGFVAGIGQAQNSHKGFGQGWLGYTKRYGAGLAEFVTTDLLNHAVMPSLFRQDPRYIYKGTGARGSRIRYAISRSVICRGDDQKDHICYSRITSRFATGEISNFYYPAADRNSQGLVVENALMGLAGDAALNLFREFLAPRLMRKKP